MCCALVSVLVPVPVPVPVPVCLCLCLPLCLCLRTRLSPPLFCLSEAVIIVCVCVGAHTGSRIRGQLSSSISAQEQSPHISRALHYVTCAGGLTVPTVIPVISLLGGGLAI